MFTLQDIVKFIMTTITCTQLICICCTPLSLMYYKKGDDWCKFKFSTTIIFLIETAEKNGRSFKEQALTDRKITKECFCNCLDTTSRAVFRLCSNFEFEHGSLIFPPQFSICDVRAARNLCSNLIVSIYLSLSNFS
jgi:hypothetical protein